MPVRWSCSCKAAQEYALRIIAASDETSGWILIPAKFWIIVSQVLCGRPALWCPLQIHVRLRENQQSGGRLAAYCPYSASFQCISKRTNVSPNILQQIVQRVHSRHVRLHAKVVTSLWQLVGRTLRSGLSHRQHRHEGHIWELSIRNFDPLCKSRGHSRGRRSRSCEPTRGRSYCRSPPEQQNHCAEQCLRTRTRSCNLSCAMQWTIVPHPVSKHVCISTCKPKSNAQC